MKKITVGSPTFFNALAMAKTSVSKKSNPEKLNLETKVDQILSIVKMHDLKFDTMDRRFDILEQDFSEFKERSYDFQDFVIKKLDTLTVEMASTHLALRRHDDRFEKLEARR